VQVAGLLKSIKWQNLDSTTIDLSGSIVGWGFNVGTMIHVGKNIKFKTQGVIGEGIENYIADVTPDVGLKSPPANPVRSFEGTALPAWGFFSFAEIKWNVKLESSIGYSMLTITNSDLQSDDAFRKGQYGLFNFRYYPVDNVMVGIEYQYGRRDNFSDGFHAAGNKMQFQFDYAFSTKIISK